MSNSDLVHELIVDVERSALLKELALNLPVKALNDRQMCDLEMLALGSFSPLKGFMTQADYEPVLDRMRLSGGALWPIPICLDVSKNKAETLEVGQSLALEDPEGVLLAILHLHDIYPINKEREADKIYQTRDLRHPGVQYLYKSVGEFYIGGDLEVVNLPMHYDFQKLRQSPNSLRQYFQKLNWKRIVGYQTRQPIHRPQFEMTLRAMKEAKANLLVLPIAGMTKTTDFDYYTRIRCYDHILKNYPPNSYLMNLLPLSLRMCGPRDAIANAIIAKNYGCTHFIVGYNHASPGPKADGEDFYQDNAAAELTNQYSQEIGVEIMGFTEMVYLPFEDEYRPKDQVPDDTQTISFSNIDMWNRFISGRRIPAWSTFPKVIKELQKAYPPPKRKGFTVFCTGLSGAGKSTIAKILYSKFLEIGERPVTLLDGDVIRRNLSSELNFSKEHRDINVRRIGFVASEITKNRGIAICAPIAPYAETRAEIRRSIETYGGFIEVFIATPMTECEKRDRKGMYAKARAGLIKGFTGVDDPYEEPQNPEVVIDTTNLTPNECAQEVLLFLGYKGYI